MEKQAEIAMVEYIKTTEPLLEKGAAYEKVLVSYQEKIAAVVDTLLSRGLIADEDKFEVSKELYIGPEKMANLVIKLASKVGPDSLGFSSDDQASVDDQDAITKFCLE